MTTDPSLDLALVAVRAADDRKGEQILALAVGELTILADYFVLVSGRSRAQVRAIGGAIEERAESELGRRPTHVEGLGEGSWVLLDYGDVIVHVLMPQEREFYQLEAFWGQAPRLDLSGILTPL